MTVDELLVRAGLEMSKHPEARWGQALANALFHLDSKLYNKIVGTEYDPFYDNNRVDKFLERVKELLE